MEKIKELYLKYKEIIHYIIFGGLTTVVNFVAYFVVARLFSIDEVISNGIAWVISVLFAYITNKLFVFESKKTGIKKVMIEMLTFFLARIVSGICCDVGTFAIMVKLLHINDVIAKIVTQIMVVIMNYMLSKLVVFRKTESKGE